VNDRLAGTLLGTALGDALGLACEGLSAATIARRFGRVERYHLLGQTGFVSDDTEQAALVSQSLARFPDDAEQCARDFRHALLGWFCRLPWGIGRATVRACLRIALGRPRSGVPSAGNGAAMRAAIIGAFFHDRATERARFGSAVAEVTHTDIRALAGALYVAELAAACARQPAGTSTAVCYEAARTTVAEPTVAQALDQAAALAARSVATAEAAGTLRTSGYTPHTVSFATYCFLRHGTNPLLAITEAISGGGDTDSIAAIVGAWAGALHGENGLPVALIDKLHDGPFGPSHLRALAGCLERVQRGEPVEAPSFSAPAAFARNVALWPVILGHGFRRLLPF
jgi:ADP-ribosylglycohydrolase